MNKTSVLTSSNLKTTKGREIILSVLQAAKQPLTAEEIFFLAKKKFNLNLSTIYRTLSTLHAKSIVVKQVLQDGVSYYQIASRAHCHILVCEECGARIPLDECPIHPLEEKITRETGFKIKGHNLEIYGSCTNCNHKTN